MTRACLLASLLLVTSCDSLLGAEFDDVRVEQAPDDPGASCTPEITPRPLNIASGCQPTGAEDAWQPGDENCDGSSGEHQFGMTFGDIHEQGATLSVLAGGGIWMLSTFTVWNDDSLGGPVLRRLDEGGIEWTNSLSGPMSTMLGLSVSDSGTALVLGAHGRPIDHGGGALDPEGYTRPAWATFDAAGALVGSHMANAAFDSNSLPGGAALALSGERFALFASSYTGVVLNDGTSVEPGSHLFVVDRRGRVLSLTRWADKESSASEPTTVSAAARGRCDELLVGGVTLGKSRFGADIEIDVEGTSFVASLVPSVGSAYRVERVRALAPSRTNEFVRVAVAPDGSVVVLANVSSEHGAVELGGACPELLPKVEDVLIARLDSNLNCSRATLLSSSEGPELAVRVAIDSRGNVVTLTSESGVMQLTKLSPELAPLWKRATKVLAPDGVSPGDFEDFVIAPDDSVIAAGQCFSVFSGEDPGTIGTALCGPDLDAGGGPLDSSGTFFLARFAP